MSSTMTLGGRRRWCTASIHLVRRAARAARFSGCVSHAVSNRPIWLAEAAVAWMARSPTTQRIAGSRRSRSASFHVLIAGEPPKHGLPQQTHQHMTTVLPSACVGEQVTRHGAEAEGIIKFAID